MRPQSTLALWARCCHSHRVTIGKPGELIFFRCCLQLTPYHNFFTRRPCGGWEVRLSLSPTHTDVSVIHIMSHIKKKSLLRYLVFWEDWLIAFCTRNLSSSCFDSLLLILFWEFFLRVFFSPPPSVTCCEESFGFDSLQDEWLLWWKVIVCTNSCFSLLIGCFQGQKLHRQPKSLDEQLCLHQVPFGLIPSLNHSYYLTSDTSY